MIFFNFRKNSEGSLTELEQRNAYLETHCKKLEENLDSEQKEKILALSKAESFESDLQKVSKCALKN